MDIPNGNNRVFGGIDEARRIEESLREEGRLAGKGLVILQCDGKGEESTYVRLKREMGERLGVNVRVILVEGEEKVMEEIARANEDESIDGILVQLPIKGISGEDADQILSTISLGKDVDGLNPKSSFVPAVVVAVETVMEKINLGRESAIAVVGSEGAIGKRLYGRLMELGYIVSGFDMGDDLMKLSEFEVVISCTGEEGVIKEEMVSGGFVGIDLGYPKGEISSEAGKKASVITPVPGGVGPLTIVLLYVNLAETE